MKKFILSITLLFSFLGAAMAQPPQDREDKVKALYVAYITREINITADEAKVFWPVYDLYEGEIKTAVSSNKEELEKQQAVLNIKKKFQDRFQKVIGSDRTNEFFVKDAEFRRRMIERLRDMRQKSGKGKGHGN